MDIIIGDQTLKLPAAAARKLRGKQLELHIMDDGIAIRAKRDPLKEMIGSLKGKVSLADFLKDRQAELDLER